MGVSFTTEGQSTAYRTQAVVEAPVENKKNYSTKLSENFGKRQIPYHEIKSPFVGTFYAAPSPDDPPYVKNGDKIEVGQTLCIVEAMKIMNEIESEVSGVIVETLVETPLKWNNTGIFANPFGVFKLDVFSCISAMISLLTSRLLNLNSQINKLFVLVCIR